MSKNKSLLTIIAAGIIFLACPFASGQKDSRYDAGMNLPFNEKAGDVNPQTGNVTIETTDLTLPGRAGCDFSFGRIWSTNQSNVYNMYWDPADDNNRLDSNTIEAQNNLGVGWSSTLPCIVKDSSSGELVITLFFGGSAYELDQSRLAVKNLSKSNILGYDLLDKRIYRDGGIRYADFQTCTLEDLQEYGVEDQQGDTSAYILLLKDNSKYWFREDGKVMMNEDRTSLNRIWYFYNSEKRLCLVVDTIGRRIHFLYDDAGNLKAIEWDVSEWKKTGAGVRERITEQRRIEYFYTDGEAFPGILNLKYSVLNYKKPYALTGFADPEGNMAVYEYADGMARFTFDSAKSHSRNTYLLLTGITSMYTEDGKYRNKRCFEYEVPVKGMYTRYFYSGYMEYYKVSRQYYLNRHGEVMNDTLFIYHENGEAGNYNQYSAVIELGNIKTTYTYSLGDAKNKNQVLESINVETSDGFRQLSSCQYNEDRAKVMDEVFRQGIFAYREKYLYDKKGNLLRFEDKQGLVVVKEYDSVFSIPLREYKTLTVSGAEKTYTAEGVINSLGQIIKQVLYMEDADGRINPVIVKRIDYDPYGNPVCEINAKGNKVHTVYDTEAHAFPIKVWQDVTIDTWADGDWKKNPGQKRHVVIRSWRVFNSDGSIWLEIDNEGYAVEHFYDNNRIEIETINPNLDDTRYFAVPIAADENGNPVGDDIDDFYTDYLAVADGQFFIQRENNPGARIIIDYQNDFIKTYADIDKSQNYVKVTGVQKDGLDHTEEEIEYGANESVFAVKRMTYDSLGRMVGLIDPDAQAIITQAFPVNGKDVVRFDKTWIVSYDDLGRKRCVLYPVINPGNNDMKTISYNDSENSITTINPEGRKVYEHYDWNGNLIGLTGYGDRTTPASEFQTYTYTYDELNRKTSFTDSGGIVTTYAYDERNLLVEQDFGEGSGSDRMEYNELGQLVKKTDRKGQRIEFFYDEMGRNTYADDYLSDGRLDYTLKLAYNNRGNTVWISNKNLVEHYIYDYQNRVISLERYLKSQTLRQAISEAWPGNEAEQVFTFSYTYNDAGMVKDMIYPDGAIHRFDYDPILGRLASIGEGHDADSIQPFVPGFTYTPSGVVTRMIYSNDTTQIWEFDNRKRISHISIIGPNGLLIEDLKYLVNSAGDILKINGNEYTYDGFDRITGARTLLPGNKDIFKLVDEYFGAVKNVQGTPGVTYVPDADIFPAASPDGRINGGDLVLASFQDPNTLYDIEDYSYDNNGNRTKLVQNGDEYTCEYGIQNRLSRIWLKKKNEYTKKLFAGYEYDANGNTIRRTINTDKGTRVTQFEYDTMNRLIKTTDGVDITDYYYDNAGNRFIKKNPEGGVTLYLRHGQVAVAMDIETRGQGSGAGNQEDYRAKVNRYVLSGDLLAGRVSRVIKVDGSVETKKSWYHLDHLNSTKCVTDEQAKVEVSYVYRAFGEQLRKLDGAGANTTDKAKYSYGGKELDDETNLYYFNARYYDATTGRFINVDPVQDGTNWYVYCGNNPLSFKDPTGLESTKAILKAVFNSSLFTALITTEPITSGFLITKALYMAMERKIAGKLYAKEKGLSSDSDNEADAYRHFTWNVENTRAFSIITAKKIADNYEKYSPDGYGKQPGSQMDLYNNSVGRQLANMFKNASAESLWKFANRLGLIINSTDDSRLKKWASNPNFNGEVKLDTKKIEKEQKKLTGIIADENKKEPATLK